MKYRDRSLFYKRILLIAIMAAMMGTVGWMIANPDHYFALRAILWGDVVERNDYMKLSGSILSPSATPQNQMVENNKFEHSLPNQLLQDALSKFQTTIRSCLGSYCMDERFTDADHNNDKIERIGILLPDKRIQWQHMIDQMKSFDNGKLSSKRNIIASTHVPAYGYGRNHGWSRIVRILDQIPLQAYQLVHDNMNKNEPDVSKSYEIQVRETILLFEISFSGKRKCNYSSTYVDPSVNAVALSIESCCGTHIHVDRWVHVLSPMVIDVM